MPITKEVIVLYTDDGTGNSIGEIVGAVVRCKDCIHYWKNKPSDDVPVCLASPKDDAFCSEGERKDDAETKADRNGFVKQDDLFPQG